ncbi:MAG: collagen-like protein [Corallococcus sp.]|nr:collagen-like protein [Corallococcus sp.]MCM1359105.1 collagen-like protein [Corallococcus sp.]MCM1395094.1 collagen-like protein [Corallococcus sp.]
MKSNRLTVVLNKKMQIDFLRGINQVYKNSYLVNDFVVRPTFSLAPTESMWVTFQNAEENPTVTLKAAMLAERKITVENSTEQVVDNDVSQILQTPDTGYEYWLTLPSAVLANEGQWYFSLEIREVPYEDDPDNFTAVSTSEVEEFTVFNSLAKAGAGKNTPTDLDVAALYGAALSSVDAAKQFAEEAKNFAGDVVAANYAPYIGTNGNWFEFSKESRIYEDTGVRAQGPEGARGPQGEQGPQGPQGPKGEAGPEGPAADLTAYATKTYVSDAIANAITTALNTPV